jgi:tetratricopeptide (TPR) repeat protein
MDLKRNKNRRKWLLGIAILLLFSGLVVLMNIPPNQDPEVEQLLSQVSVRKGLNQQFFERVRKQHPGLQLSDENLASRSMGVLMTARYLDQQLKSRQLLLNIKWEDLTILDFDEALKTMKKQVPDPEKKGEFNFLLGMLSYTVADFQNAKNYYLEAGQHSETYKHLYGYLAEILEIEGNYPAAIVQLEKQLQFQRDNKEDQFSLATTQTQISWDYLANGDIEMAIKRMKIARGWVKAWMTKFQPIDWVAVYGTKLARIYLSINQFSLALDELNTSIESLGKPDAAVMSVYPLAEALLVRGTLYQLQNNHQAAIGDFKKALANYLKFDQGENSQVASCYRRLGDSYLAIGVKTSAKKYYLKALKLYQRLYGVNSQMVQTLITLIRFGQ